MFVFWRPAHIFTYTCRRRAVKNTIKRTLEIIFWLRGILIFRAGGALVYLYFFCGAWLVYVCCDIFFKKRRAQRSVNTVYRCRIIYQHWTNILKCELNLITVDARYQLELKQLVERELDCILNEFRPRISDATCDVSRAVQKEYTAFLSTVAEGVYGASGVTDNLYRAQYQIILNFSVTADALEMLDILRHVHKKFATIVATHRYFEKSRVCLSSLISEWAPQRGCVAPTAIVQPRAARRNLAMPAKK